MKYSLLTSITLITLCGCGGGGSSASDNNQAAQAAPFTFSLTESALTIDENSKISVGITSNSSDANYTFETSSPLISASLSANNVTISVEEVDRDIETSLTVIGTLGTETISKTLSLSIFDSSGSAIADQAERLIAHQLQLSEFSQTKALHALLLDLSEVSTLKTNSEVAASNAHFISKVQDLSPSITIELQSLSNSVSNYKDGSLGELDLQNVLAKTNENITNLAQSAIVDINQLISDLGSPVPEITLAGFTYDSTLERFSLFVGNEHLGTYSQQKWQFASGFTYLDKALPNTFDTTSCNQDQQ